ncbi:MAG: hypothetical protein OEZ58_15585 [Gammaproteobacteria bacterium]|nr:hypothetical protein [Gammaproteobacteria bacterium]MDH5730417.1 hypothetical protein [Gammaproteobacteria bacterium]
MSKKKNIWISWMADEGPGFVPAMAVQELSIKGVETSGAEWNDDHERLAWTELSEVLCKADGPDAWLMVCDEEHFNKKSNRFALSLIAAQVKENRGYNFPIFLLALDFHPQQENLPQMLSDIRLFSAAEEPQWASKLVAGLYRSKKIEAPDYRFSVRANPAFGLWLEFGPRSDTWKGVMAGVHGDNVQITHQAVGEPGVLPEKCTLEYPLEGMVAQVGDTEYQAWGVSNELGSEHSYYIKVQGMPDKIIFGGHPGEDNAEVRVLNLQ